MESATSTGLGRDILPEIEVGAACRDETGLVGDHHELGAVAGVELGEQPANMGFYGGYAECEVRGDIHIGQSTCDENQDLSFAFGHSAQRAVERAGWARLGAECGDQSSGNAGGE